MKLFSFVICFIMISQIGRAQNLHSAKIVINGNDPKFTISRHIYGHFSEHLGRCIYDGFWVSDTSTLLRKDRIRLDVVEALKKIRIPNLRWPGGCFADEYHWRDGIGPRKDRPKLINTNWGNVTEDNSFGTHEFLELCSLLHTEPYICGNVGSGTVEEMNKWVEYLNFDGLSPMTEIRSQNGRKQPWRVQYLGIGNENWGCGGNMTAEFYADQYRRYATFCKNYPGISLKKIAGGPNSDDYNWTDVLMRKIPLNLMWGISLHHYTIPKTWADKGSATQFDEGEYFATMKSTLRMEELVTKHSTIMDRYDPDKRIALVVDEWGIWTNVEPGTNPGFLYQQNSMRDALVAATTLNIFNNHCDRVKMANLAQTVNVLQALILTKGHQLLLTPTYHVFDLYKVHQDSRLLPLQIKGPDYLLGSQKLPALNASASQDSTGTIHISLVNLDASNTIQVNILLNDIIWNTMTAQILTSGKFTDVNSFERTDAIKPEVFKEIRKEGNQLLVMAPKLSVIVIELK